MNLPLLLFLHFWLLFLLWGCAATIWGKMAHRTYEARMKSRFFRWFLMPGNPSERSWVRQQKVLAWIGIVVGLIVYGMVMTQNP